MPSIVAKKNLALNACAAHYKTTCLIVFTIISITSRSQTKTKCLILFKDCVFFLFRMIFISFTSVVFLLSFFVKGNIRSASCLPIPYLIPIYDYLYVLKLTRNFLKSAVSSTHTQNTDSDALLLIVSHCFLSFIFNFCSCHYYVTDEKIYMCVYTYVPWTC